MIAVGTGGIKPCVAAFGGDQFILPQQQKYLQNFFSIFYFTINCGGLMGMIIMPILRTAFTCFDDETCYALGFGFPAVLMLISFGNLFNNIGDKIQIKQITAIYSTQFFLQYHFILVNHHTDLNIQKKILYFYLFTVYL